MSKPFPIDWDDATPLPKGVTKNNQARCYNVRINVQGKQLHVATSQCRKDAAKLYDLALWKLCPKMKAKPEPNDVEFFSFLGQSSVDNLCPRLNRLYASASFLYPNEALIDEDVLRAEALNRPAIPQQGGMADYDKAIAFLARTVVELADLEVKLANRMGKLTRLHKLSEAPVFHSDVRSFLSQIRRRTDRLKNSLEQQRPYYQTQLDKQ